MRVRSAVVAAVAAVGIGTPAQAEQRVALGPLGPLADLAVQRILLADKVAAAKFGTTQPIDDPVREKQVLDDVAARSVGLGLPPDVGVRFFRAQIEANKVVQRGLFERWTAHPDQQPAERPDLAKEVRPQLDRITGQILEQLVNTRQVRDHNVRCFVWHVEAEVSADIANRLDALHRKAVTVSLRPVCEP